MFTAAFAYGGWRCDSDLPGTLFIALHSKAVYENLSTFSTSVTAHQQSAGTKNEADFQDNQHIVRSSARRVTNISQF